MCAVVYAISHGYVESVRYRTLGVYREMKAPSLSVSVAVRQEEEPVLSQELGLR